MYLLQTLECIRTRQDAHFLLCVLMHEGFHNAPQQREEHRSIHDEDRVAAFGIVLVRIRDRALQEVQVLACKTHRRSSDKWFRCVCVLDAVALVEGGYLRDRPS